MMRAGAATGAGILRASALLTLLPAALCAQSVPGRVVDDLTSRPLGAVQVMLLDSTDTAVDRAESDSLGTFVLEADGPGPYRVHANRLGYEEFLSEPFFPADLGASRLALRLVPQPMEVEGVEVTAEAQAQRLEDVGFNKRRARGSAGYFLDADEIRRARPTVTTTLLRLVPGVRLQSRGRALIPVSTRHFTGCPMKVVLDGYKLLVDSIQGIDDFVHPNDVIGVEVYPNRGVGAPPEHWGTDAFCGVIMIWTR